MSPASKPPSTVLPALLLIGCFVFRECFSVTICFQQTTKTSGGETQIFMHVCRPSLRDHTVSPRYRESGSLALFRLPGAVCILDFCPKTRARITISYQLVCVSVTSSAAALFIDMLIESINKSMFWASSALFLRVVFFFLWFVEMRWMPIRPSCDIYLVWLVMLLLLLVGDV